MKYEVPEHELSTPLHSIEGKKYPEANKKINPIQVIGIWLTHTLPESKISPENLVIEEIWDGPKQQKRLMVKVYQDLFIFFHQIP